MNRFITWCLVLGAAGALIAAAVIRPGSGHPVTKYMQEAADAAAGRTVPVIPPSTPAAATARPQIVVFILPGCPCSEDYEPLTHQLFQVYGSDIDLIGIVAGTDEDARNWQVSHKTPFAVRADATGEVARKFDAKRSAYTALVLNGQRLERLWPGYSREMLLELGTQIAKTLQISPRPLSVDAAPDRLTSGCYLRH